MYPEARREVTDFAAGDLTGLSRSAPAPASPNSERAPAGQCRRVMRA